MNLDRSRVTSLQSLFFSLDSFRVFRLREFYFLASQLTKRELSASHKGSIFGWGWQFLSPMLMLGVYTLVFTKILQLRWVDNSDPAIYSLNIFAGMLVFSVFAECATRSVTLVLENPNYVKRVRFPLEILYVSVLSVSLYRALASLSVLFIFCSFVIGGIPLSAITLPVVWLPYLIYLLSFMLLVGALGVYIRDLPSILQLLTTLLNFISGVFFPIASLPKGMASLLRVNPLMGWIESTRLVTITGEFPVISTLVSQLIISLVVLEICLRVFQKMANGFADVM